MSRGIEEAAGGDVAILRLSKAILLPFVFSLGFMQPPIELLGFKAIPGDFIYLALVASIGLAIARDQLRPRWHPVFGALILYGGALALSALFSSDPWRSAVKMLTQAYLLSLPIIVVWLVRTERDFRGLVISWLLATALVGMSCLLALTLFFAAPHSALLQFMTSDFGTLPPGDYPRLRLTFMNMNLLCNYLTASLGLVFIAWRMHWLGEPQALALFILTILAATFTISPGLGGVALLAGWLLWLSLRQQHARTAVVARAAGLVAAILVIPAMAVTPILHPTAPFRFRVPGTDIILAPAGRLLTWLDACRNFVSHPLIGRGIGNDAVSVRYQNPSGFVEHLTDAHNTFLNIAVQAGLIGLGALCVLLWQLLVIFRREQRSNALVPTVLAFSFLDALAYEGLGGSFEDARHLWVLLGLLLAGTMIFKGQAGEASRRG